MPTPAPNPTPYPVIVGPTAGGKTALAVRACELIAQRTGRPAHVISADAYQVYTKMDIGTAKPTKDERRGIEHHLIDIADPKDRFTVKDWLTHADALVADIRARNETPVLVGGTNLYVQAFLEGLFDAPEPPAHLVEHIRAIDQPTRRAKLEQIDPDAASRIDPADQRRTVRALSVYEHTGTPISELQRQWNATKPARPEAILVGLNWPAESINPRINARVKQMLDQGLADEARALHDTNALGPQAAQAIGYKQLIDYFEARCTLAEATERIKIETRRFAKNQRTWLKRFRAREGSLWIDAPNQSTEQTAHAILDALENRDDASAPSA